MDIDKSLYMVEFLKLREDLGTVELYATKNTLHINLYNELVSKDKQEDVEEVIEEIQDKSIHLEKKKDKQLLLPEVIDEDINTEELNYTDMSSAVVKKIQISEGIDMEGGASNIKTIAINNNYVAS